VDSANKYGILLEVVQVLTDLKLIVKKAYISSDGGWFMDGRTKLKLFRQNGVTISKLFGFFLSVFNVTNQSGHKIMDESVLESIKDYIYKVMFAIIVCSYSCSRSVC